MRYHKRKRVVFVTIRIWVYCNILRESSIDVEVIDCVKETKSVLEIVALINKNKLDYVGINIFTQNYDMVKYIIENIEMGCECFIGGQIVKSIYKELLQGEVSINS